MGLLACSETSDKDNTSTVTQSATKPGNIQEALKQVVQVLHAPYDKGDLFFRIFKGTDAISDYKNGDESAQIGDSQNNASNTGSGSWTVTAGKDAVTYEAAMWALIAANDGVSAHHRKAAALDAGANVTDFEAADAAALAAVNSIVYTYKDYQPNGSAIKIDGKMLAMHRSKKAAVIGGSDIDIDAIQFNKVGVDTLAVALTKLDGKAGDKAESGGAKQAAKFTANYKEGPGTSAADSIPGNINAAFKQVVQVLHAPYDKGDLFFRIFKGDTATNERKNGWDSTKVGAGDGTGSGSWTVKAGSQSTNISNGTPMVSTKRDSIIYVYNNYQPKGSHIKIDGTMAAMYRSKMKDLTPVTSMGTTLSNAIDSQFSDSIGDSLKNTIGSTHVDAISAALKNAIGDAPVAAIGASIANVLAPSIASKGNLGTDVPKVTVKHGGISAAEAFAEVVQVLHAPYTKGDEFLRTFSGAVEINESKNGEESEQIGTGTKPGSGTWAVKAGKDNIPNIDTDLHIVYTYKDYQPKGSDLMVNGIMAATYRTADADGTNDSINFNQKAGYVVHQSLISSNHSNYGTLYTDSQAKNAVYYAARKAIKDSTNGDSTAKNTAANANQPTITAKAAKAATDAAFKAINPDDIKKKALADGVGILIDTLNITGSYDATVTFTYQYSASLPTPATKETTDHYKAKLFGTDKTTQNSAGEGSGTWTVKAGAEKEAGAAKDNKIVYEYKDYQPKGSPIIVNGKMVAMTRTEGAGAGGDAVDAIGFNEAGGTALTAASIGGSSNTFDQAKSTAAKAAGIGTLVEPLNITGAYDATLTFTYTAHGIHSDVTVAKYDSYLFGERGASETNDSNTGDKSAKIGEGTETGSGTWTVKAGQHDEAAEGNDTSIVYEYGDYQPKGSHLKVTGKMEAMYRSTGADFDCADAIGFNLAGGIAITDAINLAIDTAGIGAGVAAINAADKAALSKSIGAGEGTLVETLNIDGAYQATLKFTYTDDTNVRKNGLASAKIGKGNHAGSGTWNVKAATDNSIVYEYKAYQPKGSDIKNADNPDKNPDGTSKKPGNINDAFDQVVQVLHAPYAKGGDFDCDDAIGFNLAGGIAISNAIDNAIDDAGVDASPDTVNTAAMTALSKAIEDGIARTIDTLTIDGAYKAVLKFTYTGIVIHADITESNYDTELFGNLGLLACATGTGYAAKKKADASGKTGTSGKASTGPIGTPASQQSVAIKTVFNQVVKVLHVPYTKDDFFFRNITSTDEISDSKSGSSGSWTVTAAALSTAAEDQGIVYEYKTYKANGSDLSITGKMVAMYRTKGTTATTDDEAVADSIRFNPKAADAIYNTYKDDATFNALLTVSSAAETAYFKSTTYNTYNNAAQAAEDAYATYETAAESDAADAEYAAYETADAAVTTTYEAATTATEGVAYIKAEQASVDAEDKAIDAAIASGIGKHTDTLEITGTHQATLKFVYKDFRATPLNSSSEEYQKFLIDQLFAAANAEVQFTYGGETIVLNAEQLQTLLQVVK
ncbi:hypothetical protein KUCAC02_036718 [Chaenocephalus aceratus]|nr:hypothetical protein KUCAC02_036718 [Chaenocephalus aceratus]